MTNSDLHKLKDMLETEKALLEKELASVGRINPDNPTDWEATPADIDPHTADPNDAADNVEEFEKNAAILKQLEIRLNEVKSALEKMGTGSYGVCEKCGNAISAERLEANPAASTCVEHMI